MRAFLDERLAGMAPELRARSWGGFDAAFSRALGERGWIGLTLPKEYGGGGRSLYARFVLVEELLRAGAPVAAHWIADRQSAPLILKFGTPAQAQFYLPRICRGEAFFCIGMSEPELGLRPRQRAHARDAHRQRLAAQRPEDLDHQRAIARTT